MRIAQIAPVWVPVPPPAYGGIELVVSHLAEGLVERGHEVTVFAATGSQTQAQLVSPVGDAPDLAEMGADITTEVVHTLPAYLEAGRFDVIHDHTGLGPAFGAILGGKPPVVHTLHGPWTESTRRFYAAISPPVRLIAISEAQKADNQELEYAGVVHNGIALDSFPWQKDKEDFVVFLGRCNPEKGPEKAVEVAKQAGVHLVLMMKRSEPAEIDYWEREVEPLLTGDEEVLFDVGHDVKVDYLSRAKATVFPIQWPEPFGLVMIESMACGTPVLVPPLGAAPEIVVDGTTGRLVQVDDMAAALEHIDELDPAVCREHVVQNFSADVMVEKTERVLEQAVKDG